MKTLIFSLFFFMGAIDLFAQNNALKIHASSIHGSRFKVQYERKLKEKVSVGMIGSYFFDNFSGFRVEPYGRYYLGSEAKVFDGFYFQGKVHFSHVYDDSPYREIINERGASMCLGAQHIFKHGIAVDFYAGVRGSELLYTSTSESSRKFNTVYSFPLELGISIGYAF